MKKLMKKHKELDILTLQSLFPIYCGKYHSSEKGELCDSCSAELEYAIHKTKICPEKDQGKTCSDCKVHCFEAEHRERIKEIMRFAGPRLIWSHPLLSVRYIYLKLHSRRINKNQT
jgi:Nitrous oxide-stimulated promoter